MYSVLPEPSTLADKLVILLLIAMTETTGDEELRPVPKERAILESFFTQLGVFSFDRAKDYVEREKDSSRSAGAIWASFLAALAHLAAAEKAYHNMTFLGQKIGKIDNKLIKKHTHVILKFSLTGVVQSILRFQTCLRELFFASFIH